MTRQLKGVVYEFNFFSKAARDNKVGPFESLKGSIFSNDIQHSADSAELCTMR